MFCGWGHWKGCQCEICRTLYTRNARFRRPEKSIIEVPKEAKEYQMPLYRPKPGERSGPVEAKFNDADFSSTYPLLTEHLRDAQYGDGSPRTTSTLLVFFELGVLRLCLNDRDNNRSVFFTGETMEAGLVSLENALAENRVDWRQRGAYSSRGQNPTF